MSGGRRDAATILHVVHRLGMGGLENGLVNLVNHLPDESYRHVIVSLTRHTEFAGRIRRHVELIDLHRREGKDLSLYRKLYRVICQVKPDIIHTRNLATLEAQGVAALARVPVRIHGEHGWDIHDMEGRSRKYRLLRRLHRPFVHRYVALSRQLADYLRDAVGVPGKKVIEICNGVDVERFHPDRAAGRAPLPEAFRSPEKVVIGTVGRMEPVKDPLNLARAFVHLVRAEPSLAERACLVMVGEGSLRGEVERLLDEAGVGGRVWLAGAREDVPELMRSLDLFVLPSRAEGISNTILEALASGLPVVATAVGGNPQLVEEGAVGRLVPAGDAGALAEALAGYLRHPQRLAAEGEAARRRAVEHYSIGRMVDDYHALYQERLAASGGAA